MSAEQPATEQELTILLYSHDRTTREKFRLALGRRVAADLPEIRVLEFATQQAVIDAMDRGGVDLAILDGEAVPSGGMGICRQLKDEVPNCPPVVVAVARHDDAWLATWSRADAVIAHQVDPVGLPRTIAEVVRARAASRA